MIERTLFSDEHEIFRQSVRRFMEREMAPHHEEWKKKVKCRAGPEASRRAGLSLRGHPCRGRWRRSRSTLFDHPHGGAGQGNLTDSAFLSIRISLLPISTITARPSRSRPGYPAWPGDLIAAIAMTEPGGGSDLQAIRTRARRETETNTSFPARRPSSPTARRQISFYWRARPTAQKAPVASA